MRILLITETVPYPLDTGGRIKTWHTLEALSREHEVHCYSFIRREEQRQAASQALGGVCASVTLNLMPRNLLREGAHAARSLLHGLPLTVARHYSAGAMHGIAAICRKYDVEVLYCDHLSTLEYARRQTLPVIHDAHNVEHLIVQRYAATVPWRSPRRLLLRRESRQLRTYEEARYRECALILAVSDIDAAAISRLAPRVPVVAVPIGVPAAATMPVERLTEKPEVLFVGTLDWPPNGEAVDFFSSAIWPTVQRQCPDARLTVVGRGESATATHHERTSHIRFTGWVGDVQPHFQQSRVMVVPLRSGSGMRVKILDAFARGVPVVSTRIGIEGIAAIDNQHLLIADSAEEFAAATVRVLEDRALAERLARAARELVLTEYDVAIVARRMLDAVGSLSLNRAHGPRDRAGCSSSSTVEFANR